MKLYLLILVIAGIVAFLWAHFATPRTADAITTWFIVLALAGFALVSARAILRRRPIEEPRQPADKWAASVRRMTWEPEDREK